MNRRYIVACILLAIFAVSLNAEEYYFKGEIIEINGVKAIVFNVNEDGHGTAMCLKALRGRKNAWTSLTKKQLSSLTCTSESDGKANTEAVFRFVREKGLDLSSFPAFEWCKKLGEGWYIPSTKQLEVFVNYWLGNDQSFDWDSEDGMSSVDEANPKSINKKILDNGGIPFLSSLAGYVYTSTFDDKGRVRIFTYDGTNGGAWKFRTMPIFAVDERSIGRAFIDF